VSGAYLAYNLTLRRLRSSISGGAGAFGLWAQHWSAPDRVRHPPACASRVCTLAALPPWPRQLLPRLGPSPGFTLALTAIRLPVRYRPRSIQMPRLDVDASGRQVPAGARIARRTPDVGAKNLTRVPHRAGLDGDSADMDVAADVIGVRPLSAKLSAFAVSSFYAGVARGRSGASSTWARGSRQPLSVTMSVLTLLFMIIIGGLGCDGRQPSSGPRFSCCCR